MGNNQKGLFVFACMALFLAAFFFVSNQQFKEELKVQTGTPKYNAKAQLIAAGVIEQD
uniref:Uncharacterized protein n=1 Tax=uncultured marine virus TaxID=186617 RepID=A0A0F7L458_9VIRU|nr:hypothetical protein [uncultured marine virus]